MQFHEIVDHLSRETLVDVVKAAAKNGLIDSLQDGVLRSLAIQAFMKASSESTPARSGAEFVAELKTKLRKAKKASPKAKRAARKPGITVEAVKAAVKAGAASRAEVAKKLKCTPEQASVALARAVEAKAVYMAGSRRFSRYGLTAAAAKAAAKEAQG